MCSRNSSGSPDWFWISSSDCSHWWVCCCSSDSLSASSLYIQCEATPASARRCICSVRICISTGMPKGPNRSVCIDW